MNDIGRGWCRGKAAPASHECPLLQSPDAQFPRDAPACLAPGENSFPRRILQACTEWWKITTAPTYLSSVASRRFLQPALAFAALYDVLQYVCEPRNPNGNYGWSMLVTSSDAHWDLLNFVIACLALSLPKISMWRDVILSGNLATVCAMGRWHLKLVVLNCCLGVNAAPMGGWLLLSLIYCVLSGRSQALQTVVRALVGLAVCTGLACSEHRVAFNFNESEQHRLTALRLLTHITQGYCSLNPETSQIMFASDSLEETFGVGALSGRNLTEFVNADDQAIFFEHLKKFETPPVLITFAIGHVETQVVEFDAKVVIYEVSPDTVALCIQVQGERRILSHASRRQKLSLQQPTLPQCPEDAMSMSHASFAASLPAASRRSTAKVRAFDGLFVEEGSVGSQGSLQTVHSFWDCLQRLTGIDVRPRPEVQEYLGHIPQITRDHDEILVDLMETGDDSNLTERLRERVQSTQPPPISASQWTRAALNVAETCLFEWVVHNVDMSDRREQRREEAASCLPAKMLKAQPIGHLPTEASDLIADATADVSKFPVHEQDDPELNQLNCQAMQSEFFQWFRSLHYELHPEQPELTDEELWDQWDTLAMRQLSLRWQELSQSH